jgi:hypothetical protein
MGQTLGRDEELGVDQRVLGDGRVENGQDDEEQKGDQEELEEVSYGFSVCVLVSC